MTKDLHESWYKFKCIATSRIVAGPLIVALFMFMVSNFLAMRNHFIIIDNGNVIIYTTYDNDVYNVLSNAGVNIRNTDSVTVPLSNTGGFSEVVIQRTSYATIEVDGKTHRLSTLGESVSYLLDRANVKLSASDVVEPALSTPTDDGMKIVVTRHDSKIRSETGVIPYDESRRENKRLARDTEKVIQEGVEGVSEVVYQLNYVDGKLVNEEYIGTRVLSEPVTRIVEYGTAGTITINGVSYVYSRMLEVTATAYSAESRPTARTATGTQPRTGIIAVDPKVIPLGSKVYVEGANGKWAYGIATSEDTGGVIKGNIIDLYFNTYAECFAFGRRKAVVYILD